MRTLSTRMCLLAAAIALGAAHAVPAQQAIDWNSINKETFSNFVSLIQTDSSNPPGNETEVAKKVAAILQKEGIESKLVGAEPNRLSSIARLKGNGSKKPILIWDIPMSSACSAKSGPKIHLPQSWSTATSGVAAPSMTKTFSRARS